MKSNRYLLLASLSFFTYACNSNDNPQEYEDNEEQGKSSKLTHLGNLERMSADIHFESTADPLWDKHISGNDTISDAVNKHASAWSDYKHFTENHPKLSALFKEDRSVKSGDPRKNEIRAEIKKIGEATPEIMAERRKVDLAQIELTEAKATEWDKVEGGKKYADQYRELAKQARALIAEEKK